jgi:4-hydroxybenzoate polyprenyltransferase
MVLYDVFILASLYSIRVIAGGLASDIHISFWLILFSTFIFLSLAFVKRISELRKIKDGANLLDRGRGYSTLDIDLIEMMGIASGFLSVIVFSLYINSPEVSILYSHPKVLWPLTFLFLIWISRIWVVTNRGEMTDDPIVFAIKDKGSYLILALIGLTIYFAI